MFPPLDIADPLAKHIISTSRVCMLNKNILGVGQ